MSGLAVDIFTAYAWYPVLNPDPASERVRFVVLVREQSRVGEFCYIFDV